MALPINRHRPETNTRAFVMSHDDNSRDASDAWNTSGGNWDPASFIEGWNDEGLGTMDTIYRELNEALEKENALLKRRVEVLEADLQRTKAELNALLSDVETYRARIPPRPKTPVSPREGLASIEGYVTAFWQRKTGRSPPRVAGGGAIGRLVPPRFHVITPAAGTSPGPKTPTEQIVQSDDDDEMAASLRRAYERGCMEVGLRHP